MAKNSTDRVAVAARLLIDVRDALSRPTPAKDLGTIKVSVALPDLVELLAGYLNDQAVSLGTEGESREPAGGEALAAIVPPPVERRPAFEPKLGSRYVGSADADP